MESLIVCVGEKRGHVAELVRGSDHPVTVGRSLDNTVVLTDPYVGQHQLVFFKQDAHWHVEVVDDVNPVLLNDAMLKQRSFPVTSGDRITIGRTHLDIYSQGYQVEPTRKLLLSNWLYGGKTVFCVAFLTVLVMALLDALFDYFMYAQSNEWKSQLNTVLSTAASILVWASVWSLIGRLAREQAHYALQLLVTSLACGLMVLTIPLIDLVNYITSSNLAGAIAACTLTLILLAWLLRWNIYFSTHPPKPALTALLISSACVFTYYGLAVLKEPDFILSPQYSASLKPPFALLQNGQSIGDFLFDASALTDAFDVGVDSGSSIDANPTPIAE
jgi:hypothetical protein